MRSSTLLLGALGSIAHAAWVRWPLSDQAPDGVGSWPARKTTEGTAVDESNGWTPRPTPAPGATSDSSFVLELLKRQSSSNTWVNDQTCGWFSGTSSSPWTCGKSFTCSTNSENVVGCVSGTFEPFFTVCFDYQAVQQGACASVGPQTGCCQTSSLGSCGTLIWTGSPARFMYRCFTSATIISLNDEPQFVIDAAASTSTDGDDHTTSTEMATTATSSSSSTSSTTSSTSNGGGGSSSSSTGAIVGGVVGGIAGLALIAGAVAYLVIRNKNKRYNAVPPSDPHYSPPNPSKAYPQQTTPVSQASYIPPGATTFPPQSPYPGPAVGTVGYDPRHSYYDPTGSGAPSPGQGGFGAQLAPVTELDSGPLPAGHQTNPAEMAAASPR